MVIPFSLLLLNIESTLLVMKKNVHFTFLFFVFLASALFSFSQNVITTSLPGFDIVREGISHGKIDTISYPSKTVGANRKALIYTPPGYSKGNKYPVLYLLHGIGGDEKEWLNGGQPHVILDNLYAEKKLEPMIVIMPNGRAMKDDDVASCVAQRRGCARHILEQRHEALVVFAGHLQARRVDAHIGGNETAELRLGQPVARWDDEPEPGARIAGGGFERQVGDGRIGGDVHRWFLPDRD